MVFRDKSKGGGSNNGKCWMKHGKVTVATGEMKIMIYSPPPPIKDFLESNPSLEYVCRLLGMI